MKYLLNKLAPVLGVGAYFVAYALAFVWATIPLLALSAPWWLAILFVVFTIVFQKLGALAYIIVYVWSFVIMVQEPFTAFSAIYFLAFAFWFFCAFLPAILNIFFGDRR